MYTFVECVYNRLKYCFMEGDLGMADDNINLSNKNEPKKKQRAGLNAIRPGDYVKSSFKEMATSKNFSQTEMFERMFWSYIKKENDEKRQQAIDYSSEINLISKDLDNILNHFKGITEKAQETVITITSNADQTKNNLTLDIDTLGKRIVELEKRNIELEDSNRVFNEVKASLEDTIQKQTNTLKIKDLELAETKLVLKDRNEKIKNLENIIESNRGLNERIEKENNKLLEDARNNDSRIKSLEISNNNLQSTLSTIDILKKSEIAAIDTKYQAVITNLKEQLKGFDDIKETELRGLENRLRIELDADKKLAIADMRLELAEFKIKYAEVQAEYQKLIKIRQD